MNKTHLNLLCFKRPKNLTAQNNEACSELKPFQSDDMSTVVSRTIFTPNPLPHNVSIKKNEIMKLIHDGHKFLECRPTLIQYTAKFELASG